MKAAVLAILKDEGFVKSVEQIEVEGHPELRVALKYGANREKVIKGLKRISKPGLRVYAGKDELPKVLGGLGIAIISTSKGVMTDKAARKAGLGGEVLAFEIIDQRMIGVETTRWADQAFAPEFKPVANDIALSDELLPHIVATFNGVAPLNDYLCAALDLEF